MADALLRLGTRGSPLARAQSALVGRAIAAANPGLRVEFVFIRTTGDQLAQGPLAPAGGKGLFVKEIEEALFADTIDCAVHSLKDVPAVLPAGLVIGAIPRREDPRDVLIGGGPRGLKGGLVALPPRCRLGTASVRRRAIVLACRPDLEVVLLRGNVDTRLKRWRDGEVDAILLAAAGLRRLGIEEPSARPLEPDEMLPAVGQGALALECRADDARTRTWIGAVADAAATSEVAAERAFLVAIGGDCNTPLAAHAQLSDGRDGEVWLRALVSDLEGRRRLDAHDRAPRAEAEVLGRTVARRLLEQGAGALLGR